MDQISSQMSELCLRIEMHLVPTEHADFDELFRIQKLLIFFRHFGILTSRKFSDNFTSTLYFPMFLGITGIHGPPRSRIDMVKPIRQLCIKN